LDIRQTASLAIRDSWGEREFARWLGEALDDENTAGARLEALVKALLRAGAPGAAVRLTEAAFAKGGGFRPQLSGAAGDAVAKSLESEWEASTSAEGSVGDWALWATRAADLRRMLRGGVAAAPGGPAPSGGAHRPRTLVRPRGRGSSGGAEVAVGIGADADVLPDPLDEGALQEFYRSRALEPFHRNLALFLEKRGLTRRELARRIGISESYLSQMLSGRRKPSLRHLAAMAQALDTAPGRLLGERDRAELEPGDSDTFRPGRITHPHEALAEHFEVHFYPGPDVPTDGILARTHLVTAPSRGPQLWSLDHRYLLRDHSGRLHISSDAGPLDGGCARRFALLDGRLVRTPLRHPSAEDPKETTTDGTVPFPEPAFTFLGRIHGAWLGPTARGGDAP
jgi:transcriptional regulator with XRE-family HTH domain